MNVGQVKIRNYLFQVSDGRRITPGGGVHDLQTNDFPVNTGLCHVIYENTVLPGNSFNLDTSLWFEIPSSMYEASC